jgi:hypothetical protein
MPFKEDKMLSCHVKGYFDAFQRIILFGIGLGAGSLKELVDKDP